MKARSVITLSLLICPSLFAATYNGVLYDISGKTAKFKFEKTIQNNGNTKTVVAKFTDLNGKPITSETVSYVNDHLKQYDLVQHQTKKTSRVMTNASHFLLYADVPGSPSMESLSPDTIIVDQVPDFVRRNWKSLAAKKTVDLRFIVPDRGESFAFFLENVGAGNSDGRTCHLIKMTIDTIALRPFVDPIHFCFATGSLKLIQVKGRMPVKTGSVGKWNDFDGILVIK